MSANQGYKQALYYLLTWLLLAQYGSSSSSVRPTDSKNIPLAGVNPDPFVAASPLIVAATCSDGVVLVAVHTTFSKEPLLLDQSEVNQTAINGTLLDLPSGYRGPFRIYSIDGFGTGLVCAGWRADGQVLAEYCRSVASDEVTVFGTPQTSATYGQYLSSEASLWMAQCAVSERVRSLSCVGLLASCGAAEKPGYLWLVDATGAYRVRAYAVGGGPLAATVNDHLETMDCSQWSAQETCRQILQVISDLDLPAESRIEVACVGAHESGKRRMQRLFSSRLFGLTKQKTD